MQCNEGQSRMRQILTALTPHPALSPEERVSVSDSPEGSVIAGFVPAANRSSGTLVFDTFAELTAAIVQRPTRIRSCKTAPSLPPSPPGRGLG